MTTSISNQTNQPVSRRDFVKSGVAAVTAVGLGKTVASAESHQRPNVVWIIADDLGCELGCYGNELVHTPNLDRLSSEGVVYKNAFMTAPVCSASRSALITGMYQTSIGAHNHRGNHDNPLPDGIRLVTDHFRDAGYYTANCCGTEAEVYGRGKWDFNFKVGEVFDSPDWRNREPGQPFFAQIDFFEPHRTFRTVEENAVNPDDVVLPPYYPDQPEIRKDWALYLDNIGLLDQRVGNAIDTLEEQGLLDNTVIIFFGDNGRPHARDKQFLYEGGIQVPLIVRWPGGIGGGEVSNDLVSGVDLPASSLAICGIDVPENMEGRVVLGPTATKRDHVVAARDRCDETFDRIRCVRTERFKYIRNFHPELPYLQFNAYKQIEYPAWRMLQNPDMQRKLTPEQRLFTRSYRPVEELYDLSVDPYELNNLAESESSEHETMLVKLRNILDNWVQKTGDRGATPEPLEHLLKLRKDHWEWYQSTLK